MIKIANNINGKEIVNVNNPECLVSKVKLNNSSGFIITSGFTINNTAISRGEI